MIEVIDPSAEPTRVSSPDIAVALVVMSVCAVDRPDCVVVKDDCNVVTSLDSVVMELP